MKISRFFETVPSFGPVILRLGLAAVMFPHGAQKVLGWFGGYGFNATMAAFTDKMHIPAALALLAILTEFAAPIALVFGFYTRLAALAIGIHILVAAKLGGHIANGFFMNWFHNQPGEGVEYHLLMATIAFGLVFLGGGYCALDTLIARLLGAEKKM